MLAMDSSTVIGTGMPFSSRGPNKLLISWPLSYGESIQYGRTAPALLAFTLRAGLKAFAMQLGAAVAVVFEQRDGVVDLFLYGERPFAYPTVADGKTRLLEEILFFHTASSYSRESLIAAVGQTSSQRPQKMQRPRLNCQASWLVARSVSTVRAFDGQALTQAAQPMHCCGLCSGLPRKFLSTGIGSSGYECVAVPVLMTF